MKDELPEGWVETTLGRIAEINPRHPRSVSDRTAVTFVRMAGVSASQPDLEATEVRPFGEVRTGFTHFADGDVLFAKITPCMENGKGAVARRLKNGLGCGTTELHVIRPAEGIDSDYVYRYLSQDCVRRAAAAHFTSTAGQARVPTKFIEDLEFPVPPLAEQRRIVLRLDESIERVSAARKRMAGTVVVLARLRQSILAAAYTGRLTADWRVAHPDIESGHGLLQRIETFRHNAATTTREQNQVAEAFDEARLRIDIRETGLESIPESWEGTRVGAIGTVLNGSTPSRSQPKLWGGAIAWVSSGEVRNNVIAETRERISNAGFDSCSVRLLPPGTVLLAMIGEGKTRGQTAVLEIEATINQNVAAVLIPHGLVHPRFLWWWFQFQYEVTRERGSGSGPQALNCQRVRELPFVLPPLAEQTEIVRKIDELLSSLQRIEQRFSLASAKADKIVPSLLATAFRGELVPTEAELAAAEGRGFETADALLRRIKVDQTINRPAKARRV